MIVRILLFTLLFLFSSSVFSQDFGVRIGVTTATPTGNNDTFDFDFLESFSPGYQAGLLGNFELSDVIILKPELTYREYTITQEVTWYMNDYNIDQKHTTFSADLNFDIELTNYLSLIFGIGMDYITSIQITTSINEFGEVSTLDLSEMSMNQRMDPFSNIGVCFKFGKSFLVDLQYRHLLENWETANLISAISSENGSVKLHMINLSVAILL